MCQCVDLSDDVSKARVTQQQLAARSDAVCFILKLVRIDVVEIFEPAAETQNLYANICARLVVSDSHAALHDVGVNLSDPVDGVLADHAQVSHVGPLGLALLNQRHPPQMICVTRKHGRYPLRHSTHILYIFQLSTKTATEYLVALIFAV